MLNIIIVITIFALAIGLGLLIAKAFEKTYSDAEFGDAIRYERDVTPIFIGVTVLVIIVGLVGVVHLNNNLIAKRTEVSHTTSANVVVGDDYVLVDNNQYSNFETVVDFNATESYATVVVIKKSKLEKVLDWPMSPNITQVTVVRTK